MELDKIKEEIKRSVSLVELVKQRVSLKKIGKNYRGLCPFHQEKTPSFFVIEDRNFYYCHGCCESGDVFKFLQETEGLSFMEAFKQLGSKIGYNLELNNPGKSDSELRQEQGEKERHLDILKKVADYYNNKLTNDMFVWSSKIFHEVNSFLKKKGIGDKEVKEFLIGMATSSLLSNDLIVYMKQQYNVDIPDLETIGVVCTSQLDGQYIDSFQNRIVFPIFDKLGNIISLAGRVIFESGDRKENKKYINGPETKLFDKSGTLYGLDKAKNHIKKSGVAVIVEGYCDVIVAHSEGFRNVVATMGTSLTEKHVWLLKRLAKTVVLALDGDSAGEAAVIRAIEIIRKQEDSDLDIKIAILPSGKDPDDIISQSPPDWGYLINNSLSLVDFYIQLVKKQFDTVSPRGKAQAVSKLVPIIKDIRNPIQFESYLQVISGTLGLGPEGPALIKNEITKFVSLENRRTNLHLVKNPVDELEDRLTGIKRGGKRLLTSQEDLLLATLVRYYPDGLTGWLADADLETDDFEFVENKILFEEIIKHWSGPGAGNLSSSIKDEEILTHLEQLYIVSEREPDINPEDVEDAVLYRFGLVRRRRLQSTYENFCTILDDKNLSEEDVESVLTGAEIISQQLKKFRTKTKA